MDKKYINKYSSEEDLSFEYKNNLLKLIPGNTSFKTIPSTGIKTDGFFENKEINLNLLTEFKYNCDIETIFYDCMIQVLYYTKLLEMKGEMFPNVILIANELYSYCFHFDKISKYLDENIDWSISPSTASKYNNELKIKMKNDENLLFYQFKTNNINEVINKILELNYKSEKKILLNSLNFKRFFIEFSNKIIINPKQYNSNQLVGIFLKLINNPEDNYFHPNKQDILVIDNLDVDQKNNHVKINKKEYIRFFNYISDTYNLVDKDKLMTISDQLLKEMTRRTKGEYYTPIKWVNQAHKTLEKIFGINYKDEYVFIDPAWGTGNLTKQYNFNELYCSTLNQSDIDLANGLLYNQEAKCKFQYDFLNDDIIDSQFIKIDDNLKMPKKIIEVFNKNKPTIFFMNTPYKTSGFIGNDRDLQDIKTKTEITTLMKGMGQASNQLYTQFLYRIILLTKKYKLTNVSIAFFHPMTFIAGSSYKKFRKLFLNLFKFEKGFIFNSGEFSDVSSNWSIGFSIFTSGETKNKYEFEYDINKMVDGNIEHVGNFLISNKDKQKILNVKWMTQETKGVKKIDTIHVSSALNTVEKGEGKFCEGAFGFLLASNSADCNNNTVSIYTLPTTSGGISIIKENFFKTMAGFTVRKSIITNSINRKMEYDIPNINHSEYKQWNNDCIIYSLFNNSSQQSSLRNIKYKDDIIYKIKNQFFWMSIKEIRDLALNCDYEELYRDCDDDQNRFVYNILQNINLSNDAQEILNITKQLVRDSFKYRQDYNKDNYIIKRKRIEVKVSKHLQAWDAGWYQIKLILNKYMETDKNIKNELENFKYKYKLFENRLREGVFKFNYLNDYYKSTLDCYKGGKK